MTAITQAATQAWTLPLEAYDRAVEFTAAERTFLRVELPARIKIGPAEGRVFSVIQRIVQPLEDVFRYIDFRGYKKDSLLLFLLEEMGQRGRSFWGWKDRDWIEIVERRRYDGNCLIAVAYLLCGFQDLEGFGKRRQVFFRLARRVLTPRRFANIVEEVKLGLATLGYQKRTLRRVSLTIAKLLLSNRCARLEDMTSDALLKFQQASPCVALEHCVVALSHWLASKQIIEAPISKVGLPRDLENPHALLSGVPAEWARLTAYWHEHSTLSSDVRLRHYYRLLELGRWLQAVHPEIHGPADWTRLTVAEAMVMLSNKKIGEWSHVTDKRLRNQGQPAAASTRMLGMTTLRTFFQDLQQWEMIQVRFEPYRAFRAPRSLTCQLRHNPRVLADDVWAKLMWAGMNLSQADLLKQGERGSAHYYPVPLVRALAMVWLFARLRWNEIRRLRVGCIRWQEDSEGKRVCLISVPVNKTGSEFSKPVDRLVGEAIEAWEKERPAQSKMVDAKTGELVDYVLMFRSRQIGYSYVNKVLIRTLCKKAGVPRCDVIGNITSHRARSTIASQLFNARDPMTLFEVQQWLGHKNPATTQHYIKITPTRLMKAYAKTGYFERNIRAIEVLIDQEIVWKGLGGKEPWKFFDLGHGYCSYDFFDQCPHRMACARCSFYVPKASAQSQMLEAKANLLRLRHEIPLSDEESAAVNEGIQAYEQLIQRLADVPTPAGPTPRELFPLVQLGTSATEPI
jgi:integrase